MPCRQISSSLHCVPRDNIRAARFLRICTVISLLSGRYSMIKTVAVCFLPICAVYTICQSSQSLACIGDLSVILFSMMQSNTPVAHAHSHCAVWKVLLSLISCRVHSFTGSSDIMAGCSASCYLVRRPCTWLEQMYIVHHETKQNYKTATTITITAAATAAGATTTTTTTT